MLKAYNIYKPLYRDAEGALYTEEEDEEDLS